MVPFTHEEKTMENVRKACKDQFGYGDEYQCDILAGERGPSYTNIGQIKNWKLLHVRFIESDGRPDDSATGNQAQQKTQWGKVARTRKVVLVVYQYLFQMRMNLISRVTRV
jgi:hypothetical protein